jgi:erythronate-4-phosphate dehydrogenase
MRIVVDDALAGWEAFRAFGEVVALRGRAIDAVAVREAQALIVRTVTRVDARLVEGSTLRFVGSATAGIDHVDVEALRARDIAFAHAPGCNAPAVVDYVLEAIASRVGPVGVVGHGEVGRRLTATLRGRGVDVLVDDPPRRDRGETIAGGWSTLGEILDRCRIVTFHVPAVRQGPYATRHLLGARGLDRLDEGALVINTSRGEVVDNAALEAWLAAGRGEAILDVWEGEPELRWSLLARRDVVLATPHIAGYSRLAKARATTMIHTALAQHLGRTDWIDPASLMAPGPAPEPLRTTDARLRRLLGAPAADRAELFEALRRDYPLR